MVELVRCRAEQFLLGPDELLLGHPALFDLGLLLLAVLLRVSGALHNVGGEMRVPAAASCSLRRPRGLRGCSR
jgi:hypothetical protein